MTSLTLMYVYFDKNGDIKSITPHLDNSLSEEYSSMTIPLSQAEPFLTGQVNPFNFYVKAINRTTGIVYTITKKIVSAGFIRTLDSYLTSIPNNKLSNIMIIVDTTKNSISLNIDSSYKELLAFGTDEEQDAVSEFLKAGTSTLYFTKRNNPYHCLFSVTFSPRHLLDQETIIYPYNSSIDLSDISVYTKKLISGYGFKIKG